MYVQAYVKMLAFLADAIRDLKSVPEGHLYARVMQHFSSLSAFTSAIDCLIGTGIVQRTQGHELRWIGLPDEPTVNERLTKSQKAALR